LRLFSFLFFPFFVLQAEHKTSGLSQYASDAIRMVESQSILKQDKAPIHAYRDVDHGEARFLKH